MEPAGAGLVRGLGRVPAVFQKRIGGPAKALGAVDGAQRFAPIFNDSLANLVKSLVKHRRRMVPRIALRNFCREEFFGRALKIFVYLFLVVRHSQPPSLMSSAVKTRTAVMRVAA